MSGFCMALGVAAVFWGAMMIDVPPGIEFVLVGIGTLAVSIILAVWGLWKVSQA